MSVLLASFDRFVLSYKILYVIDTAGRPSRQFGGDLPSNAGEYFDRQGFAWRPPVVAYDTISLSGGAFIQVFLADEVQFDKDAFYAVRLPFPVGPPGEVALGSADGDPCTVAVPPGDYALVYQMKFAEKLDEEMQFGDPFWDRDPHLRLTFVPDGSAEAKILQYDPQHLRPPDPLVLGFKTFAEAERERERDAQQPTANE